MRRDIDPSDLACFQHPFLQPEAWSGVSAARLTEDGARASLVCRFACAARDRCPMQDGVESVAAGGWYDQSGYFIKPEPDEMEMVQAAIYIGITPERLRAIYNTPKYKRSRIWRQLSFVKVADVRQLAEKHHPGHGSGKALMLHQLRGEQPCDLCARLLTLSSRS